MSARGKGTQIVARACGERDDWLPKTEQVDIRLRPPGVRNAPDKTRSSINLSREKKNASAKIAPPAPDAKKKHRYRLLLLCRDNIMEEGLNCHKCTFAGFKVYIVKCIHKCMN